MTGDRLDRMRQVLQRLPTLGRSELRAEWRRLYGAEAPTRLGPAVLIAAIAYRLQEDALGRLRPEPRRRLRKIAEAARHGSEVAPATPRLKPGTRLVREWQGRTYEVLVIEDGFLWQQAHYRSLSQIAREITGTRWSGPVFFGLRPRTVALHRSGGGADAAV